MQQSKQNSGLMYIKLAVLNRSKMHYSITDKQIVELYFYKFNAKLIGINVMTDTSLDWFSKLSIPDKQLLLKNINELYSSLSAVPNVSKLPLADRLEDAISAKNLEAEQMQIEREEREKRITRYLGKTRNERAKNLRRLLDNGKEEEIKRIYGLE